MSSFREQFEQMQAMARGEDTTAGAVRQTMEGKGMMKRERLEELRKIKTGFDFVMGFTPDWAEGRRAGLTDDQTEIIVNYVYQALSRNLLALIDSALAEPSDAEVAEAIEWHDNQRAGCAVSFKNFDKEEKYFELAVQALRQYQFPSAIKWTGNNLREVIGLLGWNESASSKWTWEEYEQVVAENGLKIFTPDGPVMADVGDWIIQNGKDCFVTRQYQKPTDEAPTVGDMHDYALRQIRTERPPCVKRLSCWYCTSIESHSIKSVKTVTDEFDRELGAYDTPYNYCPNCGRRLVK